jgi:hypothetical protein
MSAWSNGSRIAQPALLGAEAATLDRMAQPG